MTDFPKYTKKLELLYIEAKKILASGKKHEYISNNISKSQLEKIENIIKNIESQKSILAVLITSLIKKVVDPKQDIRLHREEFNGGYSGRTLDTNVVTPWLKKYFTRFGPKESGWLTRSIEQPKPFYKNFPGKIRNKNVKKSFLLLLDDVENQKVNAEHLLIILLIKMEEKISAERSMVNNIKITLADKTITINKVIKILKEHFATQQSSRLPVVAIYSIYCTIIDKIDLYKDKRLLHLKSHTSSDKYTGYGDIEIHDKDGFPFEIVEIKHNIPIDLNIINDVIIKIKGSKIKRYLILTTAEPNFGNNENEIYTLIDNIKGKYGVEIIVNGVVQTIKYYLRFIPDLTEFLNNYLLNLKNEFTYSTDVKESHIKQIEELINGYS
jgi:DNA (cytosine-5)-methyltransferase 1